jgi:hypothetical protein
MWSTAGRPASTGAGQAAHQTRARSVMHLRTLASEKGRPSPVQRSQQAQQACSAASRHSVRKTCTRLHDSGRHTPAAVHSIQASARSHSGQRLVTFQEHSTQSQDANQPALAAGQTSAAATGYLRKPASASAPLSAVQNVGLQTMQAVAAARSITADHARCRPRIEKRVQICTPLLQQPAAGRARRCCFSNSQRIAATLGAEGQKSRG